MTTVKELEKLWKHVAKAAASPREEIISENRRYRNSRLVYQNNGLALVAEVTYDKEKESARTADLTSVTVQYGGLDTTILNDAAQSEVIFPVQRSRNIEVSDLSDALKDMYKSRKVLTARLTAPEIDNPSLFATIASVNIGGYEATRDLTAIDGRIKKDYLRRD